MDMHEWLCNCSFLTVHSAIFVFQVWTTVLGCDCQTTNPLPCDRDCRSDLNFSRFANSSEFDTRIRMRGRRQFRDEISTLSQSFLLDGVIAFVFHVYFCACIRTSFVSFSDSLILLASRCETLSISPNCACVSLFLRFSPMRVHVLSAI